MGNIVRASRREAFDAASLFRKRKVELNPKTRSTNRLVVTYFYSAMLVVGVQFFATREEKALQEMYNDYRRMMKIDDILTKEDMDDE